MKGFVVAFEAAVVLTLAIVAADRLANPIPAGERFIARATAARWPVLVPGDHGGKACGYWRGDLPGGSVREVG